MIKEQKKDDELEELTRQAVLVQGMLAPHSKEPKSVADQLEKQVKNLNNRITAQRYEKHVKKDLEGKAMSEEDEEKMRRLFGGIQGEDYSGKDKS